MLLEFLKKISGTLDRWRSVFFTTWSGELIDSLFDMVGSHPLPRLTHLHIGHFRDTESRRPRFTPHNVSMLCQLNWDAPSLQVLRCTNIILSPECGSTQTLITSAFNRDLKLLQPVPTRLCGHSF